MQKEVVTLLVNYNKWVNENMNGIIKTLGQAEWEKPLGGFFPSVRRLCSHLYISDFNWLRRFKNFRSFTVLNDPFFDKGYSGKEILFEDMGEYLAKRPDLDSRMIAFAGELTDADFAGILKYTDPAGNYFERNFGGCVLHSLNHETHHRGMISVYLELLGKENDFASMSKML